MAFFFRTIRAVLLSLVVLASSFAVVFALKTGKMPTVSSSRAVLSKVIPALDDSCRFPLEYRVGTIDPNFHLSEAEFLKAIHEAEAIWESGTGRDLLMESTDTDAIPINLVFDDRQAETDSLKETSSDIESRKSAYESLRSEYNALRKEFDGKKFAYDGHVSSYEKKLRDYERRVEKYQDRLASYERLVAQWNAEGGAPPDEYEELEDERKDLKKEASDIDDERKRLNDEKSALAKEYAALNVLSGQVNTAAGSLNRMASALNLTVDTYNQVSGAREEFTTGLYTKDASGANIDVFQFYDHDDLVLILAHEMGHALGIGHAAESTSIMYPSVGEQKPVLTDEDRRLFEELCKE
ncbi:MAG: matrixin family metalloprotease [Candidatus Moraniibacteriota bacterium]|nr:MAG: matrixin family metalloprotease [Candidatus Moranbacteria bacterium]